MRLLEYRYKNIMIEINAYPSGEFCGRAFGDTLHGKSHKNLEQAKKNVEVAVDNFLKGTPKTWKELADMLTENLTAESYEDYSVHPDVLKTLVLQFFRANNGDLESV